MRTTILFGLAVASAFVPLAGTAAADDTAYAKLKALLPPGPGAQACYARTYDAEHLEQHPQQKVTEMVFSLRYTTLGEDEAHLVATEGGGVEKQYFDYDFTLAAKVRDQRATLYASGDCASAEGIGCGVECDGGGVEIEPVPGQDDTILVRLDRAYSYPHDARLRRGRERGASSRRGRQGLQAYESARRPVQRHGNRSPQVIQTNR